MSKMSNYKFTNFRDVLDVAFESKDFFMIIFLIWNFSLFSIESLNQGFLKVFGVIKTVISFYSSSNVLHYKKL